MKWLMTLLSRGLLDTGLLQFALTLERLESEFCGGALARFNEANFEADGLSPEVRAGYVQIGEQEQEHVNVIETLLGKDTVPPPCESVLQCTPARCLASLAQRGDDLVPFCLARTTALARLPRCP